MRLNRNPRQKVLSVKVTAEVRQLVEKLKDELTDRRAMPHTLTDVIETAIRELAGKHGVK